MALTAAQLATLVTDIAANTNTIPPSRPFAGLQIKNLAHGSDEAAEIAFWYSAVASPAYLVWQTAASKAIVDGQINKANYTPSDSVPASPSTDMTYQNRALLCQLKQTNAQWLTSGVGGIDVSIASVRQNFKDCLAQIPSGAAGANQDAGWGTAGAPGVVRLAMMRSVLRIEKLFVVAGSGPGNVGGDARGGNTNPDALVYEGVVVGNEILNAWNT